MRITMQRHAPSRGKSALQAMLVDRSGRVMAAVLGFLPARRIEAQRSAVASGRRTQLSETLRRPAKTF